VLLTRICINISDRFNILYQCSNRFIIFEKYFGVKMKKWPKDQKSLSANQTEIREDWMNYWHTVLPEKYSVIEKFNHGYISQRTVREGEKTLEIGAGLGEHLCYEKYINSNYYALELREDMAKKIRQRFPSIHTITGDCQQRIESEDNFFDRVIAIHVLEHLPNLPAAICEIKRVIKKPSGRFLIVIPCEGGIIYDISRNFTSRKIFERRYNTNYDWLIQAEHINKPKEIIEELEKEFQIEKISYFPFKIPCFQLNICIGIILKNKSS
jgi:ubiquinone/menaquinone biosynthesis C-methylase UbiE